METPHAGAQRVTEEGLRLRVELAVAELRRANAERDRLFSVSNDVRDVPDGAIAVRQAVRLQLQAVLRLREAVREFQEFSSRRWLRFGPETIKAEPKP
jgi:hypothetical protein